MRSRSSIGIPLGVAAAVLVAVVAVFAGGDSAPARLPVGLAAGRAAGAEDSVAGMPAAAPYAGRSRYALPATLPGGLPTTARAGVLTRREAPRDAVARLASALGLRAEPARSGDAWQVVDGELALRVSDAPGNPWQYGRGVACADPACGRPGSVPAVDLPATAVDPAAPATGSAGGGSDGSTGSAGDTPGSTGSGATGSSGPSGAEPAPPAPASKPTAKPTAAPDCARGTSGDTACSAPDCPPDAECAAWCLQPAAPVCSPAAPLPPKDGALAAVRTLMTAAGYDDVVLTADPGYGGWQVMADYRFDGLRVLGGGGQVTLDGRNRVTYASGSLAGARHGDRYPLLDVRAAVDRTGGGGAPEPAIACDANSPECAKAMAPAPVTAVELGLLPMPAGDTAYLVPAWLLTVRGGTYPEAVVALPDRYLAEPDGSGGGTCRGDCDTPVSTGAPVPPDGGVPVDGGGPGKPVDGGGTSGQSGAGTGTGTGGAEPADASPEPGPVVTN